ncbi:variable large family protein [Borrelia persica]|uniref:variable large family protein n=1 Tax=Borrelia persica TaxID=44448 RepID=UPI001F43C6CE|nr:variable large family protein [Borrelia persica]
MNNIIKRSLLIIMMMGMMGCNSGLVSEKEGLEKRNSFLETLVKVGEGFYEIFSSFGNVLGFNVVKADDNRSKVGEHFGKLGNGLKETKDQLDELLKKIVTAPNADTRGVEAVIQGVSEVISKLIASVSKLAGVVKANTVLGDSGAAAGQGAGPKLAAEVAKVDPWAMIDKIQSAKTSDVQLDGATNYGAGELATGIPNQANGSKAATNADLAAAVALKAMIEKGKFSAAVQDVDAVKAAAASAVNKVLGVLDIIIRKTVNLELGKIKDAVKGIQYSETTGINVPEAGTTQIPATK